MNFLWSSWDLYVVFPSSAEVGKVPGSTPPCSVPFTNLINSFGLRASFNLKVSAYSITFSRVSCCCVGVEESSSFSNDVLVSSSVMSSSSSSSLLDSANAAAAVVLVGLDFKPNCITFAHFFFPRLKERPCFAGDIPIGLWG